MIIAILLALVQAVAATPASPAVSSLSFSTPRAVAEVDTGKLKGDLSRLSFGVPEGSVYLRVAERDRWGNERPKHYLLTLAGGAVTQIEEEPAGALTYWSSKSGSVAPGVPDLAFKIESAQETKTAVGSTKEAPGVPNPFRSDPTSSQVAADVASAQRIMTTTLRLKGQLIAEAKNQPLVPGFTFGWGPSRSGLLVFADTNGRLAILDRDGKKAEVPGTSNVVLPAGSPDAQQIVYLQKKDKKKFTLMVVEVQ